MPKRKNFSDDENIVRKKKKFTIKLEPCPPVNSLKDLIDIGNQNKLFKNINTMMLWKILPYLEELNNMIGMTSVKESIFYQTIYYLQNMHLKNKNEEYLHTIILGSPGCGKCLAKNTPIIMYDGKIKMVQDIKEGDLLMGDDSTPRNILSLARGKEKMYKIKQLNGDDYVVNESHILSLKVVKIKNNHVTTNINGNKYKLNDIIDISILDYLNLDIDEKIQLEGYKVGINFNCDKLPHIDPYIIGLQLGDGISSNSNKLNIQDVNVIKYLTNILPIYGLYLHSKQILGYNSTERYIYKSNENTLKHPLDFKYENIPDIYKYTSKENRLKLLAGLIDSNGYLNKKNNYFEILYSADKEKIFDDIIYIVRSLGFSCYKDSRQLLIIEGNEIEDIPTIISEKKANKLKDVGNVLNTKITIEELGVDNYYGFTIDGNHRFLLGDFTVTHNTTVAKIIGSIYKNIGILSKKEGSFTIAGRSDLVGEYLGSTAVKTSKLLNSCLGGVLFIDEIYSLGPGNKDKDSFSKEAVDTICGFLSEHKNDFCCIVAGYEKEVINCFLSINPGLERRFPWVHKIEDYNCSDLTDIFIKMVDNIHWDLDIEKKDITIFFENNKELFKSSGGDIETFISKIKMVHSKRIFNQDKNLKFKINIEDINNALAILKKYKLQKEKKITYDYYI